MRMDDFKDRYDYYIYKIFNEASDKKQKFDINININDKSKKDDEEENENDVNVEENNKDKTTDTENEDNLDDENLDDTDSEEDPGNTGEEDLGDTDNENLGNTDEEDLDDTSDENLNDTDEENLGDTGEEEPEEPEIDPEETLKEYKDRNQLFLKFSGLKEVLDNFVERFSNTYINVDNKTENYINKKIIILRNIVNEILEFKIMDYEIKELDDINKKCVKHLKEILKIYNREIKNKK